jgi:hypothetical protein
MAKNTGIPYEILTQSIFNLILNEKRVKTITVDHDVELQGITAKHKIDVYWEFEEAGIKYRTIVQCKDWATNPVKQEQLFAFKCVLTDLPGQPRGVFVTRTGYQSGAREFAEKNGILLYELREPTAEDKKDWIEMFNIEINMFTPHFENIKPEGDNEWITSESKRLGILESSSIRICMSDTTKLYDEDGSEITDMQSLLNSLVPKGFEELKPTTKNHVFDKPTFIETEDSRIPRMKIKAIKVLISKKLTSMKYQMVGEPFVGYILKNVIEGTERTVTKEQLGK